MSVQRWDAFAVVGLYPHSDVLAECYGKLDLTCVGFPETVRPKRRCEVRIGELGREFAAQALAKIGSEGPRDQSARLTEIARRMLCRHHGHQASAISDQWKVRLQTARLSGHIPPTLSAIPRICPRPTLLDERAGATWDPFYTFDLYPDEQFHCPHGHCTKQVNKKDRTTGRAALNELSRMNWKSPSIASNLELIAVTLLCNYSHSTTSNARMLAHRWHRILENGFVVRVGEKPYALRAVLEEDNIATTVQVESATSSYAASNPQPRVAVQVSMIKQPAPQATAASTPESKATRTSSFAYGLATPPSTSRKHTDTVPIEDTPQEASPMKLPDLGPCPFAAEPEATKQTSEQQPSTQPGLGPFPDMGPSPDPGPSQVAAGPKATKQTSEQPPSTPKQSPTLSRRSSELDLPTPPSHHPCTTTSPSPSPSKARIPIAEDAYPTFTLSPPPEPQTTSAPKGSPPRPPTPPRAPASPSFISDFPTPPSTNPFKSPRPRTAGDAPSNSVLSFKLPPPSRKQQQPKQRQQQVQQQHQQEPPPPSPAQPASPTLPPALQPSAPLHSHTDSLHFASPSSAPAADLSPPATPTPSPPPHAHSRRESAMSLGYALVASTYTYGRLPTRTPTPPPPDDDERPEVLAQPAPVLVEPAQGPVAVEHYVAEARFGDGRVRGRTGPDEWDALSLPERPKKLSLWRRVFCGLGVSARRRREDEKWAL